MEKTDLLIEKCIEHLKEQLENRIPTEGSFQRISVSFDYPGTSNQALLWIESGNGSRYFCVGMREKGSDKVAYHYFAKGTNAELNACLSDDKITTEIRDDLKNLKKTVDNFE